MIENDYYYITQLRKQKKQTTQFSNYVVLVGCVRTRKKPRGRDAIII